MITIGSNGISLKVQRNLDAADRSLSSAFQRLSSGRRINSAHDDAAGLAIVTSLETDRRLSNSGRRNISDGISMTNIVSSALASQKEILVRMVELAEQAANGTYSSQQREVLQTEYSALMDEFDRVADTTEFNGIKLLRDPNTQTIQIMAGITGADSSLLQVASANSHRFAGSYALRLNWNGDTRVTNADNIIAQDYIGNILLQPYGGVANSRAQDAAILRMKASNGQDMMVAIMPEDVIAHIAPSQLISSGPSQTPNYSAYAKISSGEMVAGTMSYAADNRSIQFSFNFTTAGITQDVGIDITGLTFESRDPIGVSLVTNRSDAQTTPTAIGFTNLLDTYSSKRALDTVMNRIDTISQIEGQYGAITSRLSIAHQVLSTYESTYAAASARISDVDVANEAANLVKATILRQVSSAILAQANQLPALAIRLLS